MHLVLGQIKLHSVLEDQRDIFSKLCRISQVPVAAVPTLVGFGCSRCSFVPHIVEAHGQLNDFGIVGNYVLHRLLKYEALVLL